MSIFYNKLSWVFRPSTSLMLKLSFTKKSILLALITLYAFLIIITNFYVYLNKDIQIDKQKLVGLNLLPPLFKTIELLQQHRGLSAGVLAGISPLNKKRLVTVKLASNAFNQLGQQLPTKLKNTIHWQNKLKQWHLIIDQGMTWSKEDNFKHHLQLIKQLINLEQLIADKYYLINQADICHFYIFNSAFNFLAPSQEFLGQIRAYTTGIIAEKQSNEQQRIHLSILITQVELAIDTLRGNLKKTGDLHPSLQVPLAKVSQEILDNSNNIIALVQSNVFQEQYSTTAQNFFNLATTSISQSYQFLNQELVLTNKVLIKQQIASLQNSLKTSITAFILMLLLLLYLSIGIYNSILENITEMSRVALKLARGKLNQRISLDISNELQPLAKSFNFMADKLMQLINKEKKDKEYIKAIVDSSYDALIQINVEGKITGWNDKARQIFGWNCSEVNGKLLHEIIIPSRYRKQHIEGLKHFMATKKASILNQSIETVALHSDGHEFQIELIVTLLDVGDKFEFNAFIRDISDRKSIEERLQLSARVFAESREAIVITDADAIIIDINPAFSKITGYSREYVIGKNPRFLRSSKQPPEFYADMWKSIREHDHWKGEIWNRKKGGGLYAESLSICTLRDKKGEVIHYVGIFSDITHNKKSQEKLNALAYYDLLTQLPNRALFADRLNQAIAHSNRTKTLLAICFLDLDNFKPVNDDFGHHVGDKLLIEVAKRIKACIRKEDTISRQGGDEFTLLLGNIELFEECQLTLERIHHSLAQPYLIDGNTLNITASCGFTLYPTDNSNIDTLLCHADKAMYQAKINGKNHFHLYEG